MNIHVDDNNEILLGVQSDEIDLRAGDTIDLGSNDYNDLDNKPSIEGVELVGDLSSDDLGLADAEHTHVKADITDFAHTHTKSDVTDFSHTHVKADVTDFAHNHTKSEITDFPTIPTKTSDLDNDSGFVTADENVKQSAPSPSGYTYWRSLLVGDSSSSTEGFSPTIKTANAYAFNTLEAQPSTGTIRMGKASFFNGSYTHKLSPTTLTANRTATLPNKSGTIAFTSDIPPLVTNLGYIDPEPYEEDVSLFLNTLTNSGFYKFTFGGDDLTYFVAVQAFYIEDSDVTLVNQHYWGDEEGPITEYIRALVLESDEVVDEQTTSYMTTESAINTFSSKTHTHFRTATAAMSVWDYCDGSQISFTTDSPILYTDTRTPRHAWLIETTTTMSSPNMRYIRLTDLQDASVIYQRSGAYSAGSITWDEWEEFRSGVSKAFTVTLAAGSWSSNAQTVSNNKFIANGYAYIVSPASANYSAYTSAQIYADDVDTDGQMTFHCGTAPTGNITVNIVRTIE